MSLFRSTSAATATVAVEELRLGMFIQLEGGWMSHPFALSSFCITSEEQIKTLRSLGLKRVRWVPHKSDPKSHPQLAAAAREESVAAATTKADEASAAEVRRRQTLAAFQQRRLLNEQQHAEAATAWRGAYDSVVQRPQQAGDSTRLLVQSLLDKMLPDQDLAVTLVAPATDSAAAHALNVGVISMLLARSMGLAGDELAELGVGALMHDVGKLDVPERFRHAEDNFSANELHYYREHVAKGEALARQMGLTPGALEVVAQHHKHTDGSGFPNRAGGDRLSMGARIVALVNRYDNLCNPATRTPALTPHEAISVLFAQGHKRFDAAVLNSFIRMMGVYPVGSLVQLTDDRFAMVVSVNANRPLKPQVIVHDPRVPKAEALPLQLEHEPNLGIRRSLTAGKLPAQALAYLDPRPRVAYFFESLCISDTSDTSHEQVTAVERAA